MISESDSASEAREPRKSNNVRVRLPAGDSAPRAAAPTAALTSNMPSPVGKKRARSSSGDDPGPPQPKKSSARPIYYRRDVLRYFTCLLRDSGLGHLRGLGLHEYTSEWPRNDFKLQHVFGGSIARGSKWYAKLKNEDAVLDFIHAILRLASPHRVPRAPPRSLLKRMFVNGKTQGYTVDVDVLHALGSSVEELRSLLEKTPGGPHDHRAKGGATQPLFVPCPNDDEYAMGSDTETPPNTPPQNYSPQREQRTRSSSPDDSGGEDGSGTSKRAKRGRGRPPAVAATIAAPTTPMTQPMQPMQPMQMMPMQMQPGPPVYVHYGQPPPMNGAPVMYPAMQTVPMQQFYYNYDTAGIAYCNGTASAPTNKVEEDWVDTAIVSPSTSNRNLQEFIHGELGLAM